MNLRTILPFLFYFIFQQLTVQAKHKFKPTLQKFSWQVTIQNASIAMPPHIINGRLHPGFEMGMNKAFQTKHKTSFFNYNFLLGYTAQQSLQRTMYLKSGLGYSISLFKKWYIRPSLQMSWMRVRQSNDEFEYIGNGEYKTVDRNRFQCMTSVGFETGIPILQRKKMQYEALLKYEFGIQYPFSIISATLPINQIHFGIKINPTLR